MYLKNKIDLMFYLLFSFKHRQSKINEATSLRKFPEEKDKLNGYFQDVRLRNNWNENEWKGDILI